MQRERLHEPEAVQEPAPQPAPAGGPSAQAMLLPLVLAQFVASYAATNMNVAINSIATDLQTTVSGVQAAITLFTLTMAALMIPGSKLTDIWGRKRTFVRGLFVYGAGTLLAALAPAIGVLIVGYSLLEGVGSALMIPPIYILATVLFADLTARAKAFGAISAMAGIGAAAGPLVGGLITTAWTWRAAFVLQTIIVATIILFSRRIVDPGVRGPKPAFDVAGAIYSAVGLLLVVVGILQAGTYGWFTAREPFAIGNTVIIPKGGISPVWLFVALGALVLAGFFLHIRSRERAGREPLLSTRLFRSRASNLGLVTQNVQWLMLMGISFVVSVYLQVVRGYSAIETGLVLTPATLGILLSSTQAGRLSLRYSQRALVRAGFIATLTGIILVLLLVRATSSVWTFVPGLLAIGLGVGVMLTSSVNIVQSSFPESEQGEISGLSRSISNLGSSLGTAIAGSVIIAAVALGTRAFALSLGVVGLFGLVGLGAAFLLPAQAARPGLTGEPGPE